MAIARSVAAGGSALAMVAQPKNIASAEQTVDTRAIDKRLASLCFIVMFTPRAGRKSWKGALLCTTGIARWASLTRDRSRRRDGLQCLHPDLLGEPCSERREFGCRLDRVMPRMRQAD